MSAPEPYWHDDDFTVYAGDCLDVLRGLPDNSVDAVVTDPPAGIAFMNKKWDGDKGGREQWSAWLAEVMRECLRVAKPGAHAVVWALPRTSHWTACGLEDAGWDIRDRISHIFATGFPKSLDVSKVIDKAAGAEREIVGFGTDHAKRTAAVGRGETVCRSGGDAPLGQVLTAPATDDARRWAGWGTALKPSAEDWWVARKPLAGTVAATVTTWGTGALNIDGCRVGTSGGTRDPGFDSSSPESVSAYGNGLNGRSSEPVPGLGRWPSNVVLTHAVGWDGTDLCAGPDGCIPGCPVRELDRQSGVLTSGYMRPEVDRTTRQGDAYGKFSARTATETYGDSGGASRFFATFRYGPHDQQFLPVESGAWEQSGDGSTRDASTSAGKSTASNDESSPTDGFGNRPTDPSPMDTKSTTETTTRSTTTSATSCASLPSGTTTTTSGSESNTDGSKALNTGDANAATPTSPQPPSLSGGPAPTTGTAASAPRRTDGSGSPTTETSSTPGGVSAGARDTTRDFPVFRYAAKAPTAQRPRAEDISHPTVKPLDLLRWMVRLVTPPGGTVLDPFAGSGTTAEACLIERFRCITIERDPDYLPLIRARLSKPIQPTLGLGDF